MKMSDLFPQKLIRLPSWFNPKQKRYILNSVAKHDRLTSENARLQSDLTTITKQRDDLLSLAYELVDTLKSIGNDCGAEDTAEHIAVILSTIKEQKDD